MILRSDTFTVPLSSRSTVDSNVEDASSSKALITLTEMGGATVVGAGIAIEKSYQPGADEIRKMGYRIESLARIASMNEQDGVTFCH